MKVIAQKKYTASSGFTLIELLVVIAIISVLAVGLLAAINPLDKINSASDARVMNDLGVLARASESYSSSHTGFYPAAIADLVSASELKVAPVPPTGYAYTFTALPAACTAGTTCTSITITSPLKSNKYSTTPFQRYESATGKSCQVATAATSCP
ncbi:MAG TPA: type II secretion system protein [Candidatus Saccharimonadales bacterium]|nr:type II secretion system protein [Candidatus Saccharimonadales bacterium]